MKKVLLVMIMVVAALGAVVLWSAVGVWDVVDTGLGDGAKEGTSSIEIPTVNPTENTNPIRESYTNPFE
ncbi:MAG: hypothetical protein HQ488_03465 [Parcubacteria group bacterium]|nr:hypothetical protein [Parcubacteria group bacterium]